MHLSTMRNLDRIPELLAQLSDISFDDFLAVPVCFALILCGALPAVALLIIRRKRSEQRDIVIRRCRTYYLIAFALILVNLLHRIDPLPYTLNCGTWLVLGAGLPVALLMFLTAVSEDSESSDPPRCERCGYNLTLNVSGQCPECGKPIKVPAAQSAKKESTNTTGKPC